ncbi:hypothetical protein D9M71_170720 [compost metagenome]
MVMAVRGLPVMFTGVLPMNRSKLRPLRAIGFAAQTGVRHRSRPARRELAARPLTKVRRVGGISVVP